MRDAPGPRAREIEALGDVAGLHLLHLQCHFGLDTLSWARAGALVTGLDFSPAAIAAARDIARRSGLAGRADFVCASVYDAVEVLGDREFDVVYVSLGALCWLPSVNRWAEQVGALVVPGGRFYLHDRHPLAWALARDRLAVEHTYFEEADPFVDDSGDTYTDADRTIGHRRTFEWNHGLGETVTALLRHGLHLEWLLEHDWMVARMFPWLVPHPAAEPGASRVARARWTTPPGMPRVPLTFSLLATRPAPRDG